MDQDKIKCTQCKKLGHPLEMVFVWVKTLCGKCANCGAETNYYSMVYVDNLLVCTKCAMVQLRW